MMHRAQVIWRLDSGARTFLPRLQGALTSITPAPSDPACYVVTQADNTIRMVGRPQHTGAIVWLLLQQAPVVLVTLGWLACFPGHKFQQC